MLVLALPCRRFALKDKTNCTLVQQLVKDNHGAGNRLFQSLLGRG